MENTAGNYYPQSEEDPSNTPWNQFVEQSIDTPHSEQTSVVPETTAEDPNGASDNPPKPKDKSNYGSASRRAARNVKPREKPQPPHIPPWFLDSNVILRGDRTHARTTDGSRTLIRLGGLTSDQVAQDEGQAAAEDASLANGGSENKELDGRQQETDEGLSSRSRPATPLLDTINMREISSVVSAGLRVPSWQGAEVSASPKPHVVLFCPKNGGSSFLDDIGLHLAEENSTDFLRLTPQDIAEIGGDYMDDLSTFRGNTLSTLGYDAQLVIAMYAPQRSEDPPEEEDFDESEEEEMDQSPGKPKFSVHGRVGGFNAIHVGTFAANSFQDMFKPFVSQGGPPQQTKVAGTKPAVQLKDTTPEMKMTMLVETLLNAPETKRGQPAVDVPTTQEKQEAAGVSSTVSQHSPDEAPESLFREAECESEGLIVLIQDYPQVNTTIHGGKFLDKLHEVVEVRRREGQSVLIIGTASSKDLMPSFSKSGVDLVQNDRRNLPTRTIITPINEVSPEHTFAQRHKDKIKDINMRHLKDMLRRTAPVPTQVASLISDRKSDVDSKTTFLSGLEDSVWSFDRVGRAATTALGLLEGMGEMTIKHIEQALDIIESSDTAKVDWVANEKEHREKTTKSVGSGSEINSKERMRKLRKTCNDHEKKLLNGVVDPENIRTTFADVQASPQTIDALKTLTSLSLVRPDAFTYGVLATDRIPGLLLYGPPGTGKTLLAKAVAKESGATVLEVSGSDVYDMYVGEGEKNVRAIFTLAKKLTPCIIFIDEADAILGARTGGGNRTSHRELINQFLREWDGMTELSAFIMVATNRPFDLDEASLRRLPRRLLIDLPVEKDREAILKIHLKTEVLDPEVSVSDLASQTPFYSGSDLKNLCVAAALACVREEFDTAASHAKDTSQTEKYEYPEKRILLTRHFNKAMEEISASISEDMGSLSAIRKFDEKYGDRRGRRKKGGFGYRTGGEGEKVGSDAARVRNQS
ncbi:MAG: hypothetical protein ASARMPRED_009431 [Alectoria sarmentosa]|nr:MAG: hypothetical protein ASARMPRED_009431 [Alectoria sarmentosa]